MREIKFRAWDKDEELMHNQSDCIVIFDDIGEDVYVKDGSSVKALYSYRLMQYTGLKDKNGKEIYEGDIINAIVKAKYSKKMIIGYVKWDRGQFDIYQGFDTCDWLDSLYNCVGFYDVEVIGNIYENEDLLGA